MNLDELATATCVDPADVKVVLTWLEDGNAIPDDNIPNTVAAAVHHVLNPDSERTVLPLYYKRLDPDPDKDTALSERERIAPNFRP